MVTQKNKVLEGEEGEKKKKKKRICIVSKG